MANSSEEKYNSHDDQEEYSSCLPRSIDNTDNSTDDNDHHKNGIVGSEHSSTSDFDLLLPVLVADDEKDDSGKTRENERSPHVNVGSGVEGVGDGYSDGRRAENIRGEEAYVIEDTKERDVLVDTYRSPVVLEETYRVAERRRDPSTALVEVLGDGFGRVCVSVRGRAILDLVALFDH